MKTKKIFILGATGQIGKELALELKNSSDIKVLCHSRTKVGSSFFDYHEINSIVGKIDDAKIISMISNSDLIFDLAAPNKGTLKEIKNFYKKRLDIIIPNMKKNSKFIFASTMNAFGIDEKRKKLKDYFFSSSIYASNKRFAENYVKKLCKKNNIDIYILRLAEVHGKFQRASLHIIKLIQDKRIFEIPQSPAWITFINIIKFAIINIVYNKEKPGLYTLVCDDIFWNELLIKLSERTNTKAKYFFNDNLKKNFNLKEFIYKILINYKDIVRGNFQISKEYEESIKLDYRINKIKNLSINYNKKKIYRDYNRYSGILPGKRLLSIKYNKEKILKDLIL